MRGVPTSFPVSKPKHPTAQHTEGRTHARTQARPSPSEARALAGPVQAVLAAEQGGGPAGRKQPPHPAFPPSVGLFSLREHALRPSPAFRLCLYFLIFPALNEPFSLVSLRLSGSLSGPRVSTSPSHCAFLSPPLFLWLFLRHRPRLAGWEEPLDFIRPHGVSVKMRKLEPSKGEDVAPGRTPRLVPPWLKPLMLEQSWTLPPQVMLMPRGRRGRRREPG